MLNFVTRILLAVFICFFLFIIGRVIAKEVLFDLFGVNNAFTKTIFFDLQDIRELEIENDAQGAEAIDDIADKEDNESLEENQPSPAFLSAYTEKLDFFKHKLDIYLSKKVVFRTKMLEIANKYNGIMRWEINPPNEYNSVFMLGNGYLAAKRVRIDASPAIKAIGEIKDTLNQQGIGLLYVQVPDKVCKYDVSDALMDGVITFANKNMDDFLEGIDKKGINYIDLREELHSAKMDHHGAYFKTDHHWKPETGLWAAGVIAQRLASDYGFVVDMNLTTPDRFEYTVYKDWFLGSRGKKVTLSRAQPEDISLIHPKFATNFSLSIPDREIHKQGDFDIFYDYKQIEEKDYYKKNPYAAYLYSNNALLSIVNNNIKNRNRVLVFGESFDNSLLPFLALNIHHIDSVDLRYYEDIVKDLIKQGNYDVVIYIYSSAFLNQKFFRY